MAMIRLPNDFKDFLKLLNANEVEYLVVGGYAVGYYGNPRSTGDLDIWVAVGPGNIQRLLGVLQEFGFSKESLPSGVKFEDCYASRNTDTIDGIRVDLIDLENLKKNKRAAGRHKDLGDLEVLP
jgi:predicted nucleotidyltransferase